MHMSAYTYTDKPFFGYFKEYSLSDFHKASHACSNLKMKAILFCMKHTYGSMTVQAMHTQGRPDGE